MGASSSLAIRVHTAPSYSQRVAVIEEALEDSPLRPLPDLNEQTDVSHQTLLMRIVGTFMSEHHPSWSKIRVHLLKSIDEIERPNVKNRDGDTILHVIFQALEALQPELIERDEDLFSFFYETTRQLLRLGRRHGSTNDTASSTTNDLPVLSSISTLWPQVVHQVDNLAVQPPKHIVEAQLVNQDPKLDVNAPSGRFNLHPLHQILELTHERFAFQFLLLLLEAGVDLAVRNEEGQTFLHLLVQSVSQTHGQIQDAAALSDARVSAAAPSVAPSLPSSTGEPSQPNGHSADGSPTHTAVFSSTPIFDGQRLSQVFSLLLEPSEALARGNWAQLGDWFTLDAQGRTFVQLEEQLYGEAMNAWKAQGGTTFAPLTDSTSSSAVSSPPPLPTDVNDSPSTFASPESATPAPPWIARLKSLHACCTEFEASWLNSMRPRIHADLTRHLPDDKVVRLILACIDGYPWEDCSWTEID